MFGDRACGRIDLASLARSLRSSREQCDRGNVTFHLCGESSTMTHRTSQRRRRPVALASLLGATLVAGTAAAADPDSCKTVKMSIRAGPTSTATNALDRRVLKALGYKQTSARSSVPVTYDALKNGQIDVFLGNWMPAQANDASTRSRRPTRSSEVVRPNLSGAKYTLAVPDLRRGRRRAERSRTSRSSSRQVRRQDLRHRARQRRQPDHPRHDRRQGVRPRRLRTGRIERSRACWTQVERAMREKKLDRVPRLGAASDEHEVQARLSRRRRQDLRPELRRRDASTPSRASGYAEQCPNVGRLLKNLKFTCRHGERQIMGQILRRRQSGRRGRHGMAEGATRRADGPGSTASRPSTAGDGLKDGGLGAARCPHVGLGTLWPLSSPLGPETPARVRTGSPRTSPARPWTEGLVDLLNDHAQGFFDLISPASARPDRRPDGGAAAGSRPFC